MIAIISEFEETPSPKGTIAAQRKRIPTKKKKKSVDKWAKKMNGKS
jgi:hypothetical protein